jgi:BlaI family transcriptional regulator, penicillinase repressor
MAIARTRPTKLELTILRVLWEQPRTVREVQAVLNDARPTGYTTVLKMLQIMTAKGLVDRDETVRPQIYRARTTKEQTQRQLLRDLVERAYGGSVKALVLQALGGARTPPDTIDAIERLLDQSEARKK